MSAAMEADRSMVYRYEAVFSVFMAAVAYLWRENAGLVYPDILYLFAAIMALNLAAGRALRLWPAMRWIPAVFTLANCAAIAAVVERSGGADSNLWVLYLLPVFSASSLLGAREAGLVAVGTLLFSSAPALLSQQGRGELDGFLLLLKDGILAFAAAATWWFAQRERRALEDLRRQRGALQDMEKSLVGERRRLGTTERLADVGLMSACAAHDLRNVFGVILGFAEVGLRARNLPNEAEPDLRRIRHSAELGLSIVSGLESWSRDCGPGDEDCDLNETVDRAAGVAAEIFSRKGAVLRLRLTDCLPAVQGRPADIERVFLNLLVNAARAAGEDGTVTVSTSLIEGPGDLACVSTVVEDDGPGIPDEMMARLFKPFSTGNAASGGTGLGLFLSSAIVQRAGGALSADNRPGGGARFTVRIPVPPAGVRAWQERGRGSAARARKEELIRG
ncbi:MAG: HAMP domain-containing histidine kinase [Elusimicrobia bacterium]|nr:HAMP domain-containing histidine kinase [Elusimicrobiota bacterium]